MVAFQVIDGEPVAGENSNDFVVIRAEKDSSDKAQNHGHKSQYQATRNISQNQ